ncbi:D-glycero-alpha-D-manno-heptose-1,7-bisphosphate 7-phosphatase [Lacticaseibacillus daqingensis]|uniref:D-glycero-alpha-D-manno-heptose-1,7-bisphosphate 7-phosphatase n=1 Tax=Lacticaseibacillus daqingensis TaxID=2486014 RepID=UPI000F7A0DF0|nr:HAD-IIIA family hydrolase [Lacticaseibacillus daqingensis]
MTITTVFLDRDGTIGGDGHYTAVEGFVPYAGSVEAINQLKSVGIKVLALTNQTKIAAGKMCATELRESLLDLGCDAVFICPHAESDNCFCRKPRTGLIVQAQSQFRFRSDQAVIIGDSYRADMQCATNAGIRGIHVATGRGNAGRDTVEGKFIEQVDLAAAARWILAHA